MNSKKKILWYLLDSDGATPEDSYYTALLARADTLGYTKPTAQYSAQNTLSTSLNAGGIYSLMDVINIGAVNNTAVAQFSQLNWKTPASFQFTPVNTPAYEAKGYNSGASIAYLDTNFNPSSSGTTWVDLSSCSMSVWIPVHSSSGGDIMATTTNDTARNLIGRQSSTQTRCAIHQKPESTLTFTTGAEAAYDFITVSFYGGNRYVFKNGSTIGGPLSETLTNSANFTIRCGQSLHTGHPTSMNYGAVFIGGGITVAQHTTIYNALSQYKTDLGL